MELKDGTQKTLVKLSNTSWFCSTPWFLFFFSPTSLLVNLFLKGFNRSTHQKIIQKSGYRHLPLDLCRRPGVSAFAHGFWMVFWVAQKGNVIRKPLEKMGQDKLYKMMREHQAKGTCSHTFGALDTVQAEA